MKRLPTSFNFSDDVTEIIDKVADMEFSGNKRKAIESMIREAYNTSKRLAMLVKWYDNKPHFEPKLTARKVTFNEEGKD